MALMPIGTESLATKRQLHTRWLRRDVPENNTADFATSSREVEAWSLAQEIASVLRRDFGATRVVVFGSLARGPGFDLASDLDVAVWGMNAGHYFDAVAAALTLADQSVVPGTHAIIVDLVAGETTPQALRAVYRARRRRNLVADPATLRLMSRRIRDGVELLSELVGRALKAWDRFKADDDPLLLDATAINVHSAYTAIEQMMEFITRHIDRSPVTSDTWHRDLLRVMATELSEVRPAVLSEATRVRLDRYRAFRHIVRNVSVVQLDAVQMAPLLTEMEETISSVREELLAFASLLDEAAEGEPASE